MTSSSARPGRWPSMLSTLLASDLFPGRGQKARRILRHPTFALSSALVAALLCGMGLHPQAFLVAAGLGAVLALGLVGPWLNLAGIQARLSFERLRATEGDTVDASLTVTNRSFWSTWALAIQEQRLDAEPSLASSVVSVGARREVDLSCELTARRRGVYPGPIPISVRSSFPFGLINASRRVQVEGELLVRPRVLEVAPLEDTIGGSSDDGPGRRFVAGDHGELFGVRSYRRGDPLRRIHWAQTARHGELIVCELQATSRPRVQIVLDTDPRVHSSDSVDGSFEWAVRLAASYAVRWADQGAAIDLVVAGTSVRVSRPGLASAHALLDCLARVTPTPTQPLSETLQSPACTSFVSGLRLVITTDRGLASLQHAARPGQQVRFVVLGSAGFEPQAGHSMSEPVESIPSHLPVTPWLWLPTPAGLPAQVRDAKREVALAS